VSYLGIDVGTTGCKAGVFGGEGGLAALAYREYPLLSPEKGWAELDSRQVIQACTEVIREAAGASAADPVRALGISCQGEAFTPLSRDGEYLANGMVSSDARAAEIMTSWSRTFGARRLYEITGHTPHPMHTLFKLLWLRDHQPRIWAEAARFYCFEELLQNRLGLEPAISWPLAGRTMLFNVRSHQWDAELLALVGLDAGRLARPVPSGTVVGEIPSAVAAQLGLAR
jgi:xylulokinase